MSGNSNDLNLDAPKPDHSDWRNYRPANLQNNSNQAPVSGAPRHRDSSATAIGVAIFGILIGIAGCCIGVFALIKSMQQPQVVSTTSADGYYTGNSVEFESTSIASIVSKVTPAVVSIISQGTSLSTCTRH